jgi:hypothetical protein
MTERESWVATVEALLVVPACRPELLREVFCKDNSSEPSIDALSTRSRSEKRSFSCCRAVAELWSMPFFLVKSAMTARWDPCTSRLIAPQQVQPQRF